MWYMTLSRQDLNAMIVTEKHITNRRWLLEHKSFLAVTRPEERQYWKDVFSGKMCQIPCCGSLNEGVSGSLLEKVVWSPDTDLHLHVQVDRLMESVKKQNHSVEVNIEATSICVWRSPDTIGSYDLRNLIASETDAESKELYSLLEDAFSDEQEKYERKEIPVRMYTRAGADAEDGTLNVGLPMDCWPLTQLGELYIQAGKVRDFIRIRKDKSDASDVLEHRVLVGVIAPTSVEWIEDIAVLCVRQGGKHQIGKFSTSRGGEKAEKVSKECWRALSTMASMKQEEFRLEAPSKCPRTLILD